MGHLTTALTTRRRAREHGADVEAGEDSADIKTMDIKIKPRSVTPYRIGMVAFLLVVISMFSYGYITYGLQSTQAVQLERLTVSAVGPGIFRDFIPITGNVVPRNSVFLDSIDGGQISEIFVEEGALVEAGQSLLILKNTGLQLEVIGREAQLAEQINNLAVTQLSIEQNRLMHRRNLIDIDYLIEKLGRQHERYKQLVNSGGVTQEELENLQLDHDYQSALRIAVAESQRLDELSQSRQSETLQIAVDNLNKNISIARENLDNLTIRAPISGQLTSLEADIGESKSRGQRIGKIDEVDSFKVSAFIDEFYLARVLIGQTGAVTIDDKEYLLTVGKIFPEVLDRQFEIDLVFDELPSNVRRGQTLRLRLEIGDSTETITIPNGPYYDDTGGLWVYVVDPDLQSASRRDVRLGRRNPEYIEVIDGLFDGEQVITSSYLNFGESERLLIRQDTQ